MLAANTDVDKVDIGDWMIVVSSVVWFEESWSSLGTTRVLASFEMLRWSLVHAAHYRLLHADRHGGSLQVAHILARSILGRMNSE